MKNGCRFATVAPQYSRGAVERERRLPVLELRSPARGRIGPGGSSEGSSRKGADQAVVSRLVDAPPRSVPDEAEAIGPTFARTITTLILAGFCVIALVRVWQTHTDVSDRLIALVASGVLFGTQLAFFGRYGHNPRSVAGVAILGVQMIAAYAPLLVLENAWLSMQVMAIANLPLVLPARVGWPAWALFIGGIGVLAQYYGEPPLGVAYLVLVSAHTSAIIMGLTILRQLVDTIVVARTTIAEALLSMERLRFARDVHDLLGSRLSIIVVRCEIVRRLQTADPARVPKELRSLLDLARTALAECSGMVHGAHGVTFEGGLATARDVFAVGTTTLRTRVELPRALTKAEDGTLAAVVREGVANVLRHSDARECSITMARDGNDIELSIENDSAHPVGPSSGSGLFNLTQRMASVGGSFHSERDGDRFRIRARLPMAPASVIDDELVKSPLDLPAARPDRTADVEPQPYTDALASPGLTRGILAMTLTGVVAVEALWAQALVASPVWRSVTIASTLALALIVLMLVKGRFTRPPRRHAVFFACAVITFVPQVALSNPYLGSTGLLFAIALLTWRRVWIGVLAGAAIVATTFALLTSSVPLEQVYLAESTVIPGLAVYGVAKAIDVARRARADQWDRARLALTRERLHFEVDLNERLVGFLTFVLGHGETALRLREKDPPRAAAAVEAMTEEARAGLEAIRRMGTGYRQRATSTDGVDYGP